MDEEEQQQSDSKISVSSFFERVDSVDKVANRALSKANANFDIINNQKIFINSINVSIEALETKVRDIANYIIIEKRIEKDAEEDRLFEQQDEAQKGSMLERLAGLKSNNESEQTQTQPGEEPKKGGGGILGTLLSLGIGAFALKFLWPAILPALKGVLAGVFKSVFSWAGLKLGALLGGIIGSIPLIGKYGPKISEGIADTFNGISDWVKNLIEGLKPDGKGISAGAAGGVGNPTNERGTGAKNKGGEVEGGQRDFGSDYKSQEEYFASDEYKDSFKEDKKDSSNLNFKDNSVNSMDDTLKEKDLVKNGENVKKKGKTMVRYKYGGSTALIEKDGELDSLSKDELADKYAELHKRYLKNPDSFSDRELTNYEIKLPGLMMAKYKLFSGNIQSVLQGGDSFDPYVTSRFKEEKLEPELESNVENKDLDLSLSDSFSDKLQPLNEQIDTLSEFTTGATNTFEESQLVARPVNNPNTTVTLLKSTSSNTPFTNLMSNKHLSLNKTQKAELLRYIK